MGGSLYLCKLRTKVSSWIEWVHETMYCLLNQVQQFTGQEILHVGVFDRGVAEDSHCFLTYSWYWDLLCTLCHPKHWGPVGGDSISKTGINFYSSIFRITNAMGLFLIMSLKVCQEHKAKTIQNKQFHEGPKPWNPSMQLIVVCLHKN